MSSWWRTSWIGTPRITRNYDRPFFDRGRKQTRHRRGYVEAYQGSDEEFDLEDDAMILSGVSENHEAAKFDVPKSVAYAKLRSLVGQNTL